MTDRIASRLAPWARSVAALLAASIALTGCESTSPVDQCPLFQADPSSDANRMCATGFVKVDRGGVPTLDRRTFCAKGCATNADCSDGLTCGVGGFCTAAACSPWGFVRFCPASTTDCGATCANLQTDAANCGACRNACAAGQTCQSGACTTTAMCAMGQTQCGGACRDLQTDAAHCGACGNTCAMGQRCVAGRCAATTCATGQTQCSGACRDLQTDSAHCGACGNACPMGQMCVMGACRIDCPAPRTVCTAGTTMTCADTSTDTANCGACGNACPARANAALACTMGACGLGACNAGFLDCDTMAANGCEVNANTDTANCGGCGRSCAAGQSCVAGACATVCAMGQTNCSGTCRDLQTDSAHCGACGNACPVGQTCATGACRATVMGDTCAAPITLSMATPSQRLMGTTVGAANDSTLCAPGGDVFYRFTLTTREIVYFDTFGSAFDTQLGLFGDGTCGAPAGACSNDDCMTSQSQLVRVLPAGTYVLVVDGAMGASGAFTLNVQHLPAGSGPVNPLMNVSGTQTLMATTSGASGLATSCGVGAGPEAMWYLPTCPSYAGGTLASSTCGGATWDTVIEQRSAARTPVAVCNDDSATCSPRSDTTGMLPAGAGLHTITLDGYGASDSGLATVTVVHTPAAMMCAAGQTLCGATCRTLSTDNNNCGACGNVCPGGQSCVAGACSVCGSAYTGTLAPVGSRALGTHCYLGFSETVPWLTARDRCQSAGGYLAVVSSAAENDAARGATNVNLQAWLGIYDNMLGAPNAGTNPMAFTGLDGTTTASYHNFGGGEPNGNPGEDCVAYFEAPFRPPGTTWNDAVCTLSYAYVCEFNSL